MKKNYVLDTNVLLHDPGALFAFEDNDVIIPIYVIEEIDSFKRELSELGRSARQVSRHLDGLRVQGSLADGVELPGGGKLFVALKGKPLPDAVLDPHKADARILTVAMAVAEAGQKAGVPTLFLTKDINLRIRADALGLKTEDYEHDRVETSEVYSGMRELPVSSADIDGFYSSGELAIESGPHSPNEYALLRDTANPSHTALAKFNAAKERYVPIMKTLQGGVWGIRPRNKEQAFALDLLLNDDIKLVTVVGKAGTGKTLLAIAAGLHKTMEEQVFSRLLVSRPIFPLGRDIGFLPGSVEEKLNPWMQPIFDNVEFLMGLSQKDKKSGRSYTELLDLGVIAIEPLTYIRGRSLPGQYIIVDEAQNLTPHEVKTIITRAGDGTKIVLTGDPSQIDNPYVDAMNNGLTHVVNKFRNERLAGHITLSKGERSPLAELAATIL
jgi:PhoH-like ATPase